MISLFGSILSMLTGLIRFWPAIKELILFIQIHEDEKIRAKAMNEITRGLRYASQTGDTELLEKAVNDHCTSSGCQLP